MRRARVFLSSALALVWLGTAAAAAVPHAPGDAALPATGLGLARVGMIGSTWQRIRAQVAKLTAADGAADDEFGLVSIDGDTAVVGAWLADAGGVQYQGAAYVFYRDEGGAGAWGQVAKLTADDGVAQAHFGTSVSISGDTIVVGAPGTAVGGNADQGAAYIFFRHEGGPDAWGQVAKLTAADGAAWDHFGDVSVSGDTALVGAAGADAGSGARQGAAYVFCRGEGGPDAWGQVAKLTASDGAAGDLFGNSVSVSGDTAIAGASFADLGGNIAQGAAYVFYRDEGGEDAWGQVAKLTALDGVAGDLFGYSASVDGGAAVVGAPAADVGDNSAQGAAYVFYRHRGGPDAWGQAAKLAAGDGAQNDGLGGTGQISGGTVVLGAPGAQVGGNVWQGAAYAFYRDEGGPGAWGQVAKLTADDGAAEDWFGVVSVSSSTALVGARGADVGGNLDQGAAYVYALPLRSIYLPVASRNSGGP